MNHYGKWFAYVVGCAVIALGAACATDAFTALQIKQVQVLGATDCSVPGTPTELFRDHGVLDLALPDGSAPPYRLPVLVANNLATSGGSAAEEMNNITLRHFDVELSAPGITWNALCPAAFSTQEVTDTIAPSGAVGTSMYIIMPEHSQCLQSQIPPQGLAVTAKITAKGRHGGTPIESAPFVFTVDVCAGCLQTGYKNSALAPYQYPADVPMCSSFTGSSNPYPGDPCFPPGQDATIFCCGITETIGGTAKAVALCPGVFPPAPSSTGTSTSTSTSSGP
jgi:hypothetical protein